MLFADLVGSTAHATTTGDAPWRATLDQFETTAADTVTHHGGRLIKHTGDGTLATFPTASRALEAARHLQRATSRLRLDIRIGVHVGEIETRGDDIGGIAVHLAARVMDQARAGQILMTSAVAQTTIGGRWTHRTLGSIPLKGIDSPWELHELT